MQYIGQTGRSFKQTFQEHTRYIRHNDTQSANIQQADHQIMRQLTAQDLHTAT
jgi:hypothetical protein